MMELGEEADINAWYHFLAEECGLKIGRDWRWAWSNNAWAIEFWDPKVETMIRLKMNNDS